MTLLEVLVAAGILAFGLASLMGLLGASSSRCGKAESSWRKAHMLSQAAEYFLLCGPKERGVPQEFFPYPGFKAACAVERPEGLPDGVSDLKGSWRLVKLKISVSGLGGASSVSVEKILRGDEDL
jgi:hypothetical protein